MLLRAGHIDEAQAAFELALRMDTGYAAAMENLGDVLILQARRLYEQSLQTDARRPALRQKIDALPPLPSRTSP
jgi:tetratricopeptide (TPR) repeat protein